MSNIAVNSTATQSHGDAVSSQPLRVAQRLRAGVLFVAGLVIAFSAPLHSSLDFDRWVLAITIAVLSLTIGFEYRASRAQQSSGLILLSAAVALVAAALLFVPLFSAGSTTVALILTAWALITALITVIRLVRGALSTRVAVPSALLSAALALSLMIVHLDIIAVIGFFGAYAIIRGVFLGILAFEQPQTEPHAGADVETPQLTEESAV